MLRLARWCVPLLVFTAAHCGTNTVRKPDVTAVHVTVRYEEGLDLDQLQVIGVLGGNLAFDPVLAPEPPEGLLSPGEESLVILLPNSLAGESLQLRADGLLQGAVMASGQAETVPVLNQVVGVVIDLGPPAICGDGLVEPSLEGCDDGNQVNDDGCSEFCLQEPGWVCTGEPSVCEFTCGNGLLDLGEGCDDNNYVGGDGCSANCAVERGWDCTGEPSVCVTRCGDGAIAGTEICDDGNVMSGDGCSAICEVEAGWTCTGDPSVCTTTCGDGLIGGNENCDDGNPVGGDGCSISCVTEHGWTCTGEPSVCTTTCGDGLIGGSENCDDGNVNPGDGCSQDCQMEPGWNCSGEPSVCASTCGNGVLDGGEECDDGDLDNGDGCSSSCVMEPGWVCSGEPSVCVASCGDGVITGAEDCDDGNLVDGDGCSSSCAVEPGYSCAGEPSNCDTVCGDGMIRGAEVCDDGNQAMGDGCSTACVVEMGWFCVGEPSNCSTVCGDGHIAGTETCDDGNGVGGDGCSPGCSVEHGWVCVGEPSNCTTVCGDGIIASGEACDDGNASDGDGCSSSCEVEPGYTCNGEPSNCVTTCGDGIIGGAETCDDQNLVDGDGCDSNCSVEPGYTCNGEPSVCGITGDQCIFAPTVSASQTFQDSTSGYGHSYNGNACVGQNTGGPDRAYEIELDPGEYMVSWFTPAATWQGILYLATDCSNISATCLQGWNRNPAVGGAETLHHANNGGSTIHVFLIVDSPGGGDQGDYTLDIVIGTFGIPTLAGDVIITEVMRNPSGNEGEREWFELYNTTGSDLNLSGLNVSGRSGDTPFTVNHPLIILSGEYMIFAIDADYTVNGQINRVSWDYPGSYGRLENFPAATDQIMLEWGAITLDTVVWDGSWPGNTDNASMELCINPVDHTTNDNINNWYTAPAPWAGDDLGSPGQANVNGTACQ